MNRAWSARLALVPALLLALAGCGELTDPEPGAVAEPELAFVRLSSAAPEIEDTVVTFWAVKGQDREVQIRYYYPASHEYAKCLRFVVPADALLERPDGTAFAPGDSVEITVRMPDPTTLSFEFEPSGLEFDPAHPATVEVVYLYADPDLDGDGDVDSHDQALADTFQFWRQEAPGQPWFAVPTSRDATLAEAVASITGFTKYALASE